MRYVKSVRWEKTPYGNYKYFVTFQAYRVIINSCTLMTENVITESEIEISKEEFDKYEKELNK